MQIVNNIHQFIEDAKLQRNGIQLKDSDTISVDSALYYIGSTINYSYCFPTAKYRNIEKRTTTIDLDMYSSSKTDYNDAVSAYNDAVDSIRLNYRAITDSTKYLVAVLLDDLGNNEYNTKKFIKIVAFIGVGNSFSYFNPIPGFPEEYGFYYIRDSHLCVDEGPPPSPTYGTGAADALESELNFKYRPAPAPGYHIWYYPHSYWTPDYIDFETENDIEDNYCDYLIYYASEDVGDIDDITKCLAFDQNSSGIHEMDFYFEGAESVMSWGLNDPQANPLDHTFELLYIQDYSLSNDYEIGHTILFTWGEKHVMTSSSGYPTNID